MITHTEEEKDVKELDVMLQEHLEVKDIWELKLVTLTSLQQHLL
jgi:hypothetical protein